MTITFYNQLNDNRVVTKTLGNPIVSLPCSPFGDCSIQNPVITVRQFNGYANVNYCHIDDYGRYYYVTNVIAKSGGLLEVHCKVDVLMTYGEVIKQCSGVCVANELVGTSHIVDPNYPVECRKNTTVYEFEGEPFNIETASDNTYNFVLNVAGGENIEPSGS